MRSKDPADNRYPPVISSRQRAADVRFYLERKEKKEEKEKESSLVDRNGTAHRGGCGVLSHSSREMAGHHVC
jgi:hypothetical protein